MLLRSPTHVKLFMFATLPFVFACSNDPIAASVEDAERARALAIARQDVGTYTALTSDDLLVVNHRGAIVTKDARLGAVGSGDERRLRRRDSAVEIRRYGDVALVMGRSVWQREDQETHDYFTRIWVGPRAQWRMVASHHTDITAQVIGDEPPKFEVPDEPVPTLPIERLPPTGDAEQQVRRALDEEHRAYWRKDPDRYRQYAGLDLLRVAENGVRTREELIVGMQGNTRLPAPPPEHADLRLRVYGNVAIVAYQDNADDNWGNAAPAFFTIVFVRRDIGWQMVHIQSTAVKG